MDKCNEKSTVLMYSNFKSSKIHLHYSPCQPAARPGSTRCMAPEISDSQGNYGRFTNVTEFWKITHMGACEIIFMFSGLLIRAGYSFENIARILRY